MKKYDFKKVNIEELASIIMKEFELHDVDLVLVGGACVSIYVENEYQSYDLDYVTYVTHREVKKILKGLDFYEEGKYFVHKNCPFFIDFVTPPVAIGKDPIYVFEELETAIGKIKLLTPTDCVKDRLVSFFHWDDRQCLEQAIMVAKKQKIDIKDIEKWSKEEGFEDEFHMFLSKINN